MGLDVGHHVAQLLDQYVGQRQRQLQGDEHGGHVVAQLGQRLAVALGSGLLERGIGLAQGLHAACDFFRVRTGRAGLFFHVVAIIVFVGVFVGVVAGVFGHNRGRHFFDQVVEADDHFGQALLAFLVGVIIGQQRLDRHREGAECGLDLAQAFFDALGDGDFAFAGQQLDGAHFAHVHAHRVGGATTFGVQRAQCGGSFFGRGVIHFAVAGVAVVEQEGFCIGCNFMDINAHAVDHADDVFDLLRVDDVVGQMVIDFGVGQVALFQALADQKLDVVLLGRTFVGHVVLAPPAGRGIGPSIIPAWRPAARAVVPGVRV
ncbi:hypothetical protein D3C86_727980 [compost metagenome]